uniref:choice-of-anchor D domain-containing protein n=2 Tax=Flavobacterium sp. TaxID=239 RepID=UPI004049AE8A
MKHKLFSKVISGLIFGFLLLNSDFAFAQIINESFESATPPATNWVYNSVTHGSNNPRTGTRCATFNATSDVITTPLISNPDQLSFWFRRSSNSTAWGLTVELLNSSDVVVATLTSVSGATTSYQEYTADLSAYTNIKIKLTDTRTSGASERYVDDFSVTAAPSGTPPTGVVTGTASNISAVSADFVNNSVGGDGGSAITERGVVYATSVDPTISDTKVIVAGTTGSYTALITGLTSSTNYHVRAFATNGAGTTYGDDVSFTTNAPAGDSDSDIIENSSFTYPENIDYTAYQGTTLTTGNSIEVAQFTIRDGGAGSDSDELATTLTAIGFDVTNHENLRKIGLFDGTSLIGELDPAASISFSTLSLTANDNSTKNFSLRVSFLTSVTDNEQLTFTINSVTPEAGKSLFANADGGGATTSTAANDNTIEVTVSQLVFDVQPSNNNINVAMSPSVVVSAQDANGNLDLDSVSVLISSTGTLTGTTTLNTSNGIATFDNLIHSAAGNFVLTASSGALEVDSNSFSIVTAPWEDFETGTKGGYAIADAALTSGSWSLDDALLGTATNDRKNGSQSLRLRNGNASMNFNKTGGLGTVSILHAKYSTDIDGSWHLEASTDNGANWNAYVSPTYNTTSTTLTNQDIPVNLGGSVRFRIVRDSGNRLNFDDIYVTDYSAIPAPEINVEGNSLTISDNSTETTIANHTDFENVEVNGGELERTFTIRNLGNETLTITSITSNSTDFVVNTASTSFSVLESETTTFTVTFNPIVLGTRTGTITINSDDTDEAEYTFAVQGEGTNSAGSDIITDDSFGYASNITYQNFQATTINATADGVGLMRLTIRDGGLDANDADDFGTTLNSIIFDVDNIAFIRTVALFADSDLISNSPVINATNGTISFSGLSGAFVTAGDDLTKNISVYVTFNEDVTDNEQVQFTINSATASTSGSVFSAGNAGGAFSSIDSDINRVEVTADRLAFTTQPTGQNVGLDLATFSISGVDVFGNVDLDYTTPNEIALTTTGVDMTSSSPYIFSNGSVNIGDVQFGSAQADISLIATTSGLASSNAVTSNTFTISTVANGTYRTASSGTWPSGTATWERFTGGVWSTNSAPGANTTNEMIIRHTITTSGAFATTDGTILTVANGGTFNAGHNCTFSTLTVQDGGVFSVNVQAVTIKASTGNVIVESGGKVILNSALLDNGDGFWDGNENFKDGSILEIQNWDWDSNSGEERLIDSANAISANADGYYFGNIFFNADPANEKAFTLVGLTGNHKLCQNDLIINNISSQKNVIMTTVNANIEIGGDVIVQQNKFSFGGVTGQNTVVDGVPVVIPLDVVHNVKGNLIGSAGIIDLNQQSSSTATVFINVEGNIDMSVGSSLISTDDGCKYVFTGGVDTIQTINMSGTLGTRVDFEVAAESTLQLTQTLNLPNSSNKLTVLDGGTLDFNYFNLTGSGDFEQESNATLKITDVNGITASGLSGNIQNSGTRTFSQTGNFHYTGNVTPQSTGNVMTSGSSSKQIVIDKDSATDIVNLTQSTGTTDFLHIKKGIFNESFSAFVTGSGDLTMDDGGSYRIYVLNTTLPQIDGTYTINDGSSVELLGNGDQVLRGGKAYYDLIFGNGGTKTTTSAISTIGGGVLIDTNTTLDVDTKTFGGSNTLLFMDANSRFINGGSSTRPSIGGDYLLDETSTIEFVGTSATVIRSSGKTYANVEISGNNVTLSSNLTSLDIMANGSFKVNTNGVFKVKNDNGFSGASNTAINSTNNPTITLEAGSTIDYVHTDAQTVTNESDYAILILSGDGLKTFADDTVVNEDLFVNETASAIVPTTKTLTVRGDIIKSNTEDFTISNDAFLLQDPAQTVNNNTGAVKVQRATSLIRRGDVTIWSSPVANQNLLAFSPATLTNRFYTHDEATNAFENITPGTNVFESGQGYGIRARNTLLSTDPMENWLGTFAGVPNNGTIEFPINKTDNPSPDPAAYDPTGFNMVGNPYPSALNLLDLYTENSAIIENKFYLYEHTLPSNIPSGDLSKTNYGVLTVGTPSIYAPATQTDLSNPSDMNNYEPTIQPGQGFFVKATASGNLTFKNDMRNSTSGSFFRTNQTQNNDLDMFRIKLTAPDNYSNQAVIGFFETTSDGVDATDTKGFSSAPIYSILGNDKFVIQARSYPLNQNTVIPVGFHASISGSYTLSLFQPMGIFEESQYVILHDLVLGTYHNLTNEAYTFDIENGTHNERFEIIFTAVLSQDVPEFEAAQLIAFAEQNQLNVNLKGQSPIEKVTVYDMSGRLLYEASDVNAASLQIKTLKPTASILLVQATNQDGQVFTTKLFY